MKIVLKTIKKVLIQLISILLLVLFACSLLHILSCYFLINIANAQLNKQFQKVVNSGFIKSYSINKTHHLLSTDENIVLIINPKSINVVLDKFATQQPLQNNGLVKNLNDASDIKISYHNKISYGLFSGVLHGNFIPMIAFVKTEIEYPPEVNSIFHKIFGKDAPVTIYNSIFLDKSGQYSISSPKFYYEEAVSGIKVVSQGISLTIRYDSTLTQFYYKLNIPFLLLNIPTILNSELNNLLYTSQVKHLDSIIADTKTSLSFSKFNLQIQKIDDNVRSKIEAICSYFSGISYLKTIENIAFDSFSNFGIDNLSYKFFMHGEDKFVNSSVVVTAGNLSSNSKNYKNLKFDINIDHIFADSFYKLLDENQNSITPDLLLTIANNNPSIKINEISLDSEDGHTNINGIINIQKSNITEVDAIFDNIHAEINMKLPKAFLSYLFLLHMKYFLISQNTELDKTSEKTFNKILSLLFNTQIKIWIKKSFINNDNGILSTKLVLDDGELYLNNHQVKALEKMKNPKI